MKHSEFRILHDTAPDWDGEWHLYCGDQFICLGNNLTDDKANAEFIVKACNSHYDLLEALKGAQEELRLIRMKDTGAVYNTVIRIQIKQAIKKAEGEG